MSIIKNNSREECRKMRRKCKLFVLNGIKYTIQEPITRPTMRMLTKGGLVVTLDFDKNFEWLNQVTKRWSGVKKYQHETADRISGISIKTSMGDVLVHVIKLNGEQTYLLNCYILGGNLCDTQILVDISGAQAKYIVASARADPRKKSQQEAIVKYSQVIASIFIGAKVYLNVTGYHVYDEVTRTEGPRITRIEPDYIFGRDVLLS